ncbi:Inactive 5-amino-6-(5-phosphoribosylamino)uracil reductase [Actinidia chinensis var. chinensis]|uniref:Inactive 5-amino-6-(5-phosphoribosylamino)uracil reductase n=1 Tax=Actinidia chinensis var. chinensis TaxID=1590841 RepID=A0A2R6Q8X7_ACTCC|nr:Inactive 5-amino-6-(5-phosphoribosylamino)uracil reductase [Actinidia chinensis var. chinensis]
MNLQTHSFSRYSLAPTNFSASANFPIQQQYSKLVPTSILKSGFCSSAKKVFRLVTGMRSRGGFVGVRCEVKDDSDGGFYMRRCVELARKAIGCTSPNPMVGCVIVEDGKIVGEGFHPKAGQSHAEGFCLERCWGFG